MDIQAMGHGPEDAPYSGSPGAEMLSMRPILRARSFPILIWRYRRPLRFRGDRLPSSDFSRVVRHQPVAASASVWAMEKDASNISGPVARAARKVSVG